MANTKFSVIIPCYNSAEFISKCLESIINTNYKNLEIICVDDGSKDNTLEILKQYSNKDDRIKIIVQQNKGAGEARNSGLNCATGDYVCFCDSDDTVSENIYFELNNIITKYNPEVVQFNINIYRAGQKLPTKSTDNRISYNWRDCEDFFKECRGSCWNKTYSLKFLKENNLNFLSTSYGEDTCFTRAVVLSANKVYLLHKCLYNYHIRENSTVATNSKQHNTFYFFEQIDYIENFLSEKFSVADLKALTKQFKKHKMRLLYLGEKRCLKQLKREYMKECRLRLNMFDYMGLVIRKNISSILRNIFSVRRNVDGTSAWGIILLGKHFKISSIK